MSLQYINELLHPSNENIDDTVSPIEANDKADDILEALEFVNAPSEALKISEEIDSLLFAANALNTLHNTTVITDANASEIVTLSKDVVSTSIPTEDVDISLESVTHQIKHIVNKIKEMIKQFFLAIGRSFGLWRTRVMIVLKELDKSERVLKQHIKVNGNTRINSVLSPLDLRWHKVFNVKSGHAETINTPADATTKQTNAWIHQRDLAIKTCKNIANNISKAETSKEVTDEIDRLQFSANPAGNDRLFLLLLGGTVISTDPYRFMFDVTPYPLEESSEMTHHIDTNTLLGMIVKFKEAGKKLLDMELEAERDNAKLENLYLHIANKAEYNNSDSIRRALGRLKEATFKIFRGDAAVIDSFVHLSKIYVRKVNTIK